jgi:hypothetical protein
MSQCTPLNRGSALLLGACLLTGCADRSQAMQQPGVEDDVAELVVRRVLARPELMSEATVRRASVCLLRGAASAPPRLLKRFERDERHFTTADSLGGCWRLALGERKVGFLAVAVEDVSWAGGDRATAEVSYGCNVEGCARGTFALKRGAEGWRVDTERFCSQDPTTIFEPALPLCPER